jgi:hypothetical protein
LKITCTPVAVTVSSLAFPMPAPTSIGFGGGLVPGPNGLGAELEPPCVPALVPAPVPLPAGMHPPADGAIPEPLHELGEVVVLDWLLDVVVVLLLVVVLPGRPGGWLLEVVVWPVVVPPVVPVP